MQLQTHALDVSLASLKLPRQKRNNNVVSVDFAPQGCELAMAV
jgi:hypothetical protein